MASQTERMRSRVYQERGSNRFILYDRCGRTRKSDGAASQLASLLGGGMLYCFLGRVVDVSQRSGPRGLREGQTYQEGQLEYKMPQRGLED